QSLHHPTVVRWVGTTGRTSPEGTYHACRPPSSSGSGIKGRERVYCEKRWDRNGSLRSAVSRLGCRLEAARGESFFLEGIARCQARLLRAVVERQVDPPPGGSPCPMNPT